MHMHIQTTPSIIPFDLHAHTVCPCSSSTGSTSRKSNVTQLLTNNVDQWIVGWVQQPNPASWHVAFPLTKGSYMRHMSNSTPVQLSLVITVTLRASLETKLGSFSIPDLGRVGQDFLLILTRAIIFISGVRSILRKSMNNSSFPDGDCLIGASPMHYYAVVRHVRHRNCSDHLRGWHSIPSRIPTKNRAIRLV